MQFLEENRHLSSAHKELSDRTLCFAVGSSSILTGTEIGMGDGGVDEKGVVVA